MAGVTSPLAFPYPTGTDRVADGDNAIQALAEKVDDYLAPDNRANVPVTVGSGWAAGANLRLRRVGDLVCLTLDLTKATWGAGEGAITIPVGYRPATTVYFFAAVIATGAPHSLYVRPDGFVVTSAAATNGSGIVGNVTFPAA